MKNRQWIYPIGTLILGISLGTLWSPLTKPLTPEQLAAAQARHATKSGNHSSTSRSYSTSNSSTRSHSHNRQGSSLYKELTMENLLLSFAKMESEKELNLMELTRYGAQLASMSETEVTALLFALQGPFEGEHENMQEIAEPIIYIAFSRLCELNGPEAMRMLQAGELGEDIDKDIAITGMNAWVAADPEGAKHWFEGTMKEADEIALAGGDEDELTGPAALLIESTDITAAYLRGMSTLDPEAVKNDIASFQSEEVRGYIEDEFNAQLIDQAKTKDEILTLLADDSSLHSSSDTQSQLVFKLSAIDTKSAIDWVQSQKASSQRDNMVRIVASSLLQENPAEGAAWYQAQELSGEEPQAERLHIITSSWMRQDLEGAATWLLEQPNNNQRDSSEFVLATESARKGEWEAAFLWSSDISNAQSQQRSLNKILERAWNNRSLTFDPSAITAARDAGYSQAVEAFIQSKTPAKSEDSR